MLVDTGQNLAAPSTSRRVQQYLEDDPGSLSRRARSDAESLDRAAAAQERGQDDGESAFDFFRHV